ncbi:MAG: hypothetical protein ACOC95_06395 [Planctomycetota bacterium]
MKDVLIGGAILGAVMLAGIVVLTGLQMIWLVFRTRRNLKNIAGIYDAARTKLRQALEPLGYAVTADQYDPGAFGSRYVDVARGAEAFRLIWDGKDGWFYLQSTNVYVAGDFRTQFTDKAIVPFDSREVDGTRERLLSEISTHCG